MACPRCRSRRQLLDQLRKDVIALQAALQATNPNHPLLPPRKGTP